MSLRAKRILIAVLGATFLASLLLVQYREIIRKAEEAGVRPPHISVALESQSCVECHDEETPAITAHWRDSTHAEKGVACYDCHKAEQGDADGFEHEGAFIATLVTPLDCSSCHGLEFEQFTASHHAKAGNILHSLDNQLAETVEGMRGMFNPHSSISDGTFQGDIQNGDIREVNGLAFAHTGCHQCHGSKVGLEGKDGIPITADELQPKDGQPTNAEAVARIVKDENGKPKLDATTWPNTGIGRLNLDGSRGSCSACHSRHDFSPRRARQPENCGKCHLGPDHPQKEIYEESKHGVAYRDLKDHMNLDSVTWVLGEDYTHAPTCATCHMSAHTRNKNDANGGITHDPGKRISWTNRPAVSLVMDTDAEGAVVKETDPEKRKQLVAETADVKRTRMKDVCSHCHSPDYVNGFYQQYDNFVVLYNEKYGKPGAAIVAELKKQGLLTATPFDEEVEWTWFYLWHHEGRRARHGASMMAPDYAHWHGTYEVAERFYVEFIPQVREIAEHAKSEGKTDQAEAITTLVEEVLSRPEHVWFEREKKEKAVPHKPHPPADPRDDDSRDDASRDDNS